MKYLLLIFIFISTTSGKERDYFQEPNKEVPQKNQKNTTVKEPEIVKPDLKVIGTIITEDSSMVVAKLDKNIIYLKIGNKIHQGTITWTVASITTDGLTMTCNKNKLFASYQ